MSSPPRSRPLTQRAARSGPSARLYVARPREAEWLAWLLQTEPLAVLIGPPGAGKSTLIQHELLPLLHRRRAGGWTVLAFDLDAERAALEAEHGAQPPGRLLARLGEDIEAALASADGPRLLVIDGFEALVDCPGLRDGDLWDWMARLGSWVGASVHLLLAVRDSHRAALAPLHGRVSDFDAMCLALPPWSALVLGPRPMPAPTTVPAAATERGDGSPATTPPQLHLLRLAELGLQEASATPAPRRRPTGPDTRPDTRPPAGPPAGRPAELSAAATPAAAPVPPTAAATAADAQRRRAAAVLALGVLLLVGVLAPTWVQSPAPGGAPASTRQDAGRVEAALDAEPPAAGPPASTRPAPVAPTWSIDQLPGDPAGPARHRLLAALALAGDSRAGAGAVTDREAAALHWRGYDLLAAQPGDPAPSGRAPAWQWLAPLPLQRLSVVVRSDAPWVSIDDLRGRRLNVGPAGERRALSGERLMAALVGPPAGAAGPLEGLDRRPRDEALQALLRGDADAPDAVLLLGSDDSRPSADIADVTGITAIASPPDAADLAAARAPDAAARWRVLPVQAGAPSTRRLLQQYLLDGPAGAGALAVQDLLVAPATAPADVLAQAVSALCQVWPALQAADPDWPPPPSGAPAARRAGPWPMTAAVAEAWQRCASGDGAAR